MDLLEEIRSAVVEGNAKMVEQLTEKAVSTGLAVTEILSNGLIAGMSEIGIKFRQGEVYVPEVLVAARAMHAGMDVIKPTIVKEGIREKGTVVIGTVKGDLHDIGKNLVIMMLEGNGYKVVDLGVDVPLEVFIKAVDEHKPQVVGLSALLTTTMPQMKLVTETLKRERGQVKVIIGGAPVTQKFADQIGADGYGADVAVAVELVDHFTTI